MKKLTLFITIIGIICSSYAYAQENSDKSITFYYIDHNGDTPVGELCEDLKNYYRDARNYNLPTVFYLANMKSPIYAICGAGDPSESNFDNIIRELQVKKSHDVDSQTDIRRIVDIFNSYDFINEDGKPFYTSMTWTFFIDQYFWDLGYNEKIIATLYSAMEIDSLPKDFFNMKVYYSGVNDFVYDKDKPFGDKDLCYNLDAVEIVKY